MKTINFFAKMTMVLGFAIGFAACDNDAISDEALAVAAQDEAQISSVSDDVLTDADEYINANLSGFQMVTAAETQKIVAPRGATVTVVNEGNPFPKVITIDYGTEGVVGKRGNVFKGKIVVRVTGRMDVAGSSRTYTMLNFTVNGNSVKGIKTVTYNGDSTGKKTWTVVVNDTVVKAADAKMITSKSTRIRTLLSNNNTPNVFFDDKFSIQGSSSGVNAAGKAYSVKITKPLIIDGAWPVFVEGTTLLETEKRIAVLDYGDGTRDMIATVTSNGVSKTITLRK